MAGPAPRPCPAACQAPPSAQLTIRRRTVDPMTMKSVDLPHLRSVVLAGHAGGGKTTLAEQLLFRDGAIFVVDASAGIESGLEQAVALGRSSGRAACFFINRSDKENADPTAALD